MEDRLDGSLVHTFLTSDSGERYELSFSSEPARLLTGDRVRVRGARLGQAIVVESGSRDLERLSGIHAESIEATTVLPNTFGAQSTVILLVNFSDNTTQPYTASYAKGVAFTTTSNFDLENSYGQTWLTGDVFGWYTIALSSTVCDYATLAGQANSAATAAGVNLSNYTHYVYAFPNNACAWWGLGTIGGSPSQAWVNGSFQLQVVAHEMGHNFGLYHAHSLDCGSVTLGSTCTMSEYGDTLDDMGGSSAYHFNAFQKERLGWLSYGSSPPITTVTSNGSYSIDAYETAGSAAKALKVAQGTTGNYFYVELRQGIGFDSGLSSNGNVTNGVVVHLASLSDGNTGNLLDMTPATSSWTDPALGVGQSFTDSSSGVTIAPLAIGSSGATVSVTVSGSTSTCTHVSPSIALSPSQSAGAAAGTSVSFTLSLTNMDGSACTASLFNLAPSLPPGWTASLASSTLSVAAGASAATSLTVTSPSSAANGSYTVGVTATSQSASTASASASAVYVVNNPGASATPPTVAITSPATGTAVARKSTVTITATASDNLGVARVEFYVGGSLVCTDTSGPYTCGWKVPGRSGANYSLQAKAYDTAGNVGASALVTLTAK